MSKWVENLSELLSRKIDPNQQEIWDAIWGDI
jgi:hypothetical protein